MSDSILLFKRGTRRIPAEQLETLAGHLGVKGKTLSTDEALCCRDEQRALAYAQPCSPFGGLLFFADQSVAWGEADGKVLPAERAEAWTRELLEKFALLPRPSQDERISFDFKLYAQETDAMVFDGKERRAVKAKTDVMSSASLNGVPVVGPRAQARLIFKQEARPVMMHIGLWDTLAVHEERELVREHDVARTVADKLAQRKRCEGKPYHLHDMRLVYMAGEFSGAPDLLVPEYHVEIELVDARHDGKNPPIPPRQVLRLPAYR